MSDALVDRVRRVDPNLRIYRWLIRRRNSGELGDLARPRLGIQALDIAGFAHLERCVDKHFDEGPWWVQRSNRVAVSDIRRYECGEHDQSRVLEETTHLANPADVLGAILGSETQVAIEPKPDVVAVEHIRGNTFFDQRFLDRERQR